MIVAQAREKFVDGDPRVWWLSLKVPATVLDSAHRSFMDVVPNSTERAWFIPEDDTTDLPVYDVTPDEVELLRMNCPLFEYNVVDKLFRWMIVENDHDQFIICAAA
jgi:hypothetical protein